MADQPPIPDNYVPRALELLAGYGDQEAIVLTEAGGGDSRQTYAELTDAVPRLATVLREHGIEPGTTVAMLVRDHLDSAALHLALHLLGCRTVWIATYAPPQAQGEFFQLSGATVLIYTVSAIRENLVARLRALDDSVTVFSLGPGDQGTDLLADLPSVRPAPVAELAGPAPESLFYTGGTTGRPKLIHHGQSFYLTLLAIAGYYVSVGEPPMRFLSGTSFTHVSGQMPAFLTLFEGGTLFLYSDFTPATWLADIEKYTATSAFLTPAQLYTVLDHPAAATADTSSLRYLNVGGAAASPARLTEGIARFGPVLRIVYGASEAPLITDLPFLDHDPDHPERLSSAGRPFADTRIEVRDEQGHAVPAGEAGEVWLSGSLRMAGYWQQPDLTAHAISDGWLRTGDVGYLDDDGYLYLVDRVNDMIVTSEAAANVYARPVEDALTSHPQVRAAAVIGVPHEAFGEAVHAFVVTQAGAGVTAGELRELVRERLNDLYAPSTIEFVDELPLTAMTKVDKKALRARYLAARAPEATGAV